MYRIIIIHLFTKLMLHDVGSLTILFGHDARSNVHCLQLLKQKLACIWNFNICEFGSIFTHVAAMYAHLVIHCCNHPATLANKHLVFVG